MIQSSAITEFVLSVEGTFAQYDDDSFAFYDDDITKAEYET